MHCEALSDKFMLRVLGRCLAVLQCAGAVRNTLGIWRYADRFKPELVKIVQYLGPSFQKNTAASKPTVSRW